MHAVCLGAPPQLGGLDVFSSHTPGARMVDWEMQTWTVCEYVALGTPAALLRAMSTTNDAALSESR